MSRPDKQLDYLTPEFLRPLQCERAGEDHVADVIRVASANLSLEDNLKQAYADGVNYILLGVPEDIGPRANVGQGGAMQGWPLFLQTCLRRQANQFFDWRQCMVLGALDLSDLQEAAQGASIEQYRQLCERVDERVSAIVKRVFELGMEALVIGGGHNNAYPLIGALSEVSDGQVACCNLDPHADMRALEGRHSGNPFSYAYQHGYLGYYHVMGLHEQKNNQATLDLLTQSVGGFTSYQSLFVEKLTSFERAVQDVKQEMAEKGMPVGIELDVDTIKYTPASAYSVSGFTLEQASYYLNHMAQLAGVRYCHICEGAVAEMDTRDAVHVGQTLTELVYSFLIGRARRKGERHG
ncbi:arginase family protein [Alteromonas sediminis]|uniref:arginase family protein n=1 Tax=Alteromonas sediminis TaxID=2259342 RepID=UPI0014055926|nr:arginase family protein [Alteromonas sediminis]